ncbi:DUF4260 family protein [Nonomuraea harbinensis]|uniref:DUF4260 family protein n=1 Tax=Nonomuraea harbinensis TaxID=1286938 RepID=A0ABW1BS15_9ACTN|nr:DUF4260 family protein [Nonomuraea harbinensis]
MRRGAWGGLAIFCLAFIVFEVAKHGGMAWVTAVVFAILPDLTMLVGARKAGGGRLSPRAVPFYNAAHRAWAPLLLLVGYIFWPIGGVPTWTAGLAWLMHIAADRAFGYGLRERDGSRRVRAVTADR